MRRIPFLALILSFAAASASAQAAAGAVDFSRRMEAATTAKRNLLYEANRGAEFLVEGVIIDAELKDGGYFFVLAPCSADEYRQTLGDERARMSLEIRVRHPKVLFYVKVGEDEVLRLDPGAWYGKTARLAAFDESSAPALPGLQTYWFE